MRIMRRRHLTWLRVLPVLLVGSLGGFSPMAGAEEPAPPPVSTRAQTERPGGIGAITSVQGRVTMDHPDPDAPFQARTAEPLQFQDVIETDGASKTKVLLHSGGVLTVGENSRIEIVEHDHQRGRAERSVTIKLVRGSLRALVGTDFASPASKFEVQMPAAVAQSHGGLFVVWADKEQAGAANIGSAGGLDFIAGGQTARLEPGDYSQTAGGGAPAAPARIEAALHPIVNATIAATHLRESPRHEAAKDTLREIGMPRALGLGLGGDQVGGAPEGAAEQSAGVDEAQGGGQTKAQAAEAKLHNAITNHNRTPPSVHSRSSERLLRPHEGAPLRGQERIRQ